MIIALVNYYDEGSKAMSKMVHQLAKMKVDRIIACNGPYALYPNTEQRITDPVREMNAFKTSCQYYGIELEGYEAPYWSGNEYEKRQFALTRAAKYAPDFVLIWDVDFFLEEGDSDPDLRKYIPILNRFGDFMIYDEGAGNPPWRNRPLLRWNSKLRYKAKSHHVIICEDYLHISTGLVTPDREPYGTLLPLTIRHDRGQRSELRLERQQQYYDNRDRLRAEV